MFKNTGPGVLIAAAFIGPGTVTACTLAGVGFGYALLWAMLVSIIATISLQQMAARLGIISQKGLADVIKQELQTPWLRKLVIAIILAAIVIGNAAYEAGNIGGAVLGMQALFGETNTPWYPLIIGAFAFALLYFGNYKVLQSAFLVLVLIMSSSFILTAILTGPSIPNMLSGLFIPTIPQESILTIIALVGTTVVPYNLFLHASLVSEKWKKTADLGAAKRDTVIAVAVGGCVSISIIISAAALPNTDITNVLEMASALTPLFGASATYFMGIGLFAAGITSAITAPLAAAYVANSCFGWGASFKDTKFRLVWMLILGAGVFFLSFNLKPIQIIKFAQIANGILLPVIAIFLLWVVNKKNVMGSYVNTRLQNIIGIIIILLSVILGAKSISTVIGLL